MNPMPSCFPFLHSSVIEGLPVLLKAATRPLCIKTRPIIERFLRPDAGCRKSGIQISAAHCLLLRHSFRQEYRETPNESVARASTVDALHRKRRQVLAYFTAREHRSVGSQRDDDATNSAF